MKKIICGLAAACLMAFGAASLAADMVSAPITITGTPVMLEKNGDMWTAPERTTMSRDGYYYFNYAGTSGQPMQSMACYKERPQSLMNASSTMLDIKIGSNPMKLYCYPTNDTKYFMVK